MVPATWGRVQIMPGIRCTTHGPSYIPLKCKYYDQYALSCSLSLSFQTVRDIVWSMSNDELRTFVEKNQNKEIDGQFYDTAYTCVVVSVMAICVTDVYM